MRPAFSACARSRRQSKPRSRSWSVRTSWARCGHQFHDRCQPWRRGTASALRARAAPSTCAPLRRTCRYAEGSKDRNPSRRSPRGPSSAFSSRFQSLRASSKGQALEVCASSASDWSAAVMGVCCFGLGVGDRADYGKPRGARQPCDAVLRTSAG